MQSFQQPSVEAIAAAIQRLAREVAEAHQDCDQLAVIGIAEGGMGLAQRLAGMISEKLGRNVPCGVIDISFHRDDISSNPVPNIQCISNLSFDVDHRAILLVDDVIFTGRSARAALNEIFDQGRPDCVRLAVMVERSGRCLPIQPDYVGMRLEAPSQQRIVVSLNDDPDQPDSISITNRL